MRTIPPTRFAPTAGLLAFAEHFDGDLELMGVEPVLQFLTDIATPGPGHPKRAAVEAKYARPGKDALLAWQAETGPAARPQR